MKAIANTTIRLGLINLPVGVCKATGELDDVSFKLGGPNGESLSQVYVIEGTDKQVERDDMTRTIDGHIIDKDALEAIKENTKLPDLTILKVEDRERWQREMHRCTGQYFLQSTKKTGNVNAYKLFADALKETGKVAVTKWTARSRQNLMVIWTDDDGVLRGSTMSFACDARTPDENVRAHLAGTYTEAEMDMAKQLLSALASSDADPLEMETDEAVSMRHELVQKAMQGETITTVATAEQPAKNAALADALAASLAALQGDQVAVA